MNSEVSRPTAETCTSRALDDKGSKKGLKQSAKKALNLHSLDKSEKPARVKKQKGGEIRKREGYFRGGGKTY